MTFPCQGRWWVPGFADKAVFGTLTFTRRDGAKLSLANSLRGSTDVAETEVVVGQAANGEYLTLLHAIRTNMPMFRLTETAPCSYHATCVIAGAGFDTIEDMRFSLWQLRCPALRAWAGGRGFVTDESELFSGDACRTVGIRYWRPPTRVLLEPRGALDLDLSLRYWPLVNQNWWKISIRQDVCLEVRHSTHDSLDDYMRTTTRLEHFLTLATGSLIHPAAIKAVVRTPAGEEGDPVIVEILYQPVRKAPQGADPRVSEQLFGLADIGGFEQDCFANWFVKAEWLDPVAALYFGALYNPSKYLDLNFLALVQSVEAYHRRASTETDASVDDHAARMQAILKAAPAEHADWLREKLRYSNEINLRRRLKGLFAEFSYIFDDLLPDRNRTIHAICDNRNYLTHYDPAARNRALKGARLLFLVEVLKLLIQVFLMRELGLSEPSIKAFASRSRSARMLEHLSARISEGTN